MQLQPRTAAYWDTLGAVQQALGKPTDAIASYQKAIALAPTESETLYQLAVLQTANGQPSEARRHLQTALAQRQGNFPSLQAAKDLLSTLK